MQFSLSRLFFLVLVVALCIDFGLRIRQASRYNSAENDTQMQNAAGRAMRVLPWEILALSSAIALLWGERFRERRRIVR